MNKSRRTKRRRTRRQRGGMVSSPAAYLVGKAWNPSGSELEQSQSNHYMLNPKSGVPPPKVACSLRGGKRARRKRSRRSRRHRSRHVRKSRRKVRKGGSARWSTPVIQPVIDGVRQFTEQTAAKIKGVPSPAGATDLQPNPSGRFAYGYT